MFCPILLSNGDSQNLIGYQLEGHVDSDICNWYRATLILFGKESAKATKTASQIKKYLCAFRFKEKSKDEDNV